MNSMQLNLNNVITTLKANINPTRVSRPKKKNANDYPALGDVKRFENLPDQVNQDFISLYRENLDEFLVPYIQYGEMTVSNAHNFIEGLVEQIFGNENHHGIFSYLKERNYENSAERELVRAAERLINSGWRVVKDGKTNRYKMINGDKDTVIDATGVSEFYRESSAGVMDETAAHTFIDSQNAAKIESLARSLTMDADDLTKIDSLDELTSHTEDKMLVGVLTNYKKLRNVLKKQSSYPVLNQPNSFSDLYREGFTVCNKKVFSEDNVFTMRNGEDDYIIYPVSPELNQPYGFNKSMLSVIASKFKVGLLDDFHGVVNQDLLEIADLGRVIALMSKFWDNDITYMSRFDVADALSRLERYKNSGEISTEFYNKIFSNFAVAVAIEAILFGNNWFSLSSFGFDSISGKFYLYANSDAFTTKIDQLDYIYDNYNYQQDINPKFDYFLSKPYPFRFNDQASMAILPVIIENLPKDFFSALSSFEPLIEMYPFKFNQITDYMMKAKDLLMSRAK